MSSGDILIPVYTSTLLLMQIYKYSKYKIAYYTFIFEFRPLPQRLRNRCDGYNEQFGTVIQKIFNFISDNTPFRVFRFS